LLAGEFSQAASSRFRISIVEAAEVIEMSEEADLRPARKKPN